MNGDTFRKAAAIDRRLSEISKDRRRVESPMWLEQAIDVACCASRDGFPANAGIPARVLALRRACLDALATEAAELTRQFEEL